MKNILLSSLVVVLLIGSANMFAMNENVVNSGLTLQQLNALAGPSKLGAAKFNAAKGAASFSLADYQAWVKAGKPAPGAVVAPKVQVKGGEAAVITYQRPDYIHVLYAEKDAAKTEAEIDALKARVEALYNKSKGALDAPLGESDDLGNLLADLEVKKTFGSGGKALGIFAQMGGKTEPEAVTPTSPRTQAAAKERDALKAIETIAESKASKAEALSFLDDVETVVNQLRGRESITSKP